MTFTEIFNEKAKAHALAEGRREGRRKCRISILMKLLARRFGDLPSDLEERLEESSEEELDRWTDNMISAATYDEVALPPQGTSPFSFLMRYLDQVTPTHVDRILNAIESHAPDTHNTILTFSEVFAKRVRSKALAEGEQSGQHKQHIAVLLKQFNRKFGDLPPAVRERVTGASEIDLEQWTDNIITASTIEDVFAQQQD